MTHRSSPLRRLTAALLCLGCGAIGANAGAQDLEPRAYSNAPVGLNFAIAGYAYSHGDVSVDAALPLENGQLEISSAVLAYARVLDVFGTSGKVDVVVPYGYLSGSATFAGEPVTRRVHGLGDARLRFSLNLYGAPALSFAEFESYEQDVIVGASLYVNAPIGQYDSDRLVNLGNHRWAFKPELGISKSWDPFILELSVASQFFTENRDFFGGHERSQEPIYSAQVHAIYAFKRGFWGSLDLTYYGGGVTSIDGNEKDDRLSNMRVGATIAIPVNRYNSIKLYGSSGVWTRTGRSYDLIGAAWQVRWGGGL